MFPGESLHLALGDFGLYVLYSVVIAVVTWFSYSWKVSSAYPPCIKGWIPFLGCAIEFGKAPLWFIKSAKDKHGPVFTLYVASKRMTFITETEDFKYFFQSSNVDFQRAVQQPVKNNASISKEGFYRSHTKIHDLVKGRLAAQNLGVLSEKLYQGFRKQLDIIDVKGKEKVDLMDTIRRAMYAAVMDNLFGAGMLPTHNKEKLQELTDHFVLYDDQFEYGSQLPEFFLKDWSKSKWFLLNMFADVVKKAEKQNKEETLLQSLIQTVADREFAPNFSLMMLWASLANAIPITFWTIAYILNNEEIYTKATLEINKVLGSKPSTETAITEQELKQMPYIKYCFLEAIRLRSPGVIARQAMKSFSLRGFTVPEGDMLMLSPYWAHRNETFFPEPEKFNPDRWQNADLEKNLFLDGFVAFGGGRYQCPGRWYALMELHMFIAMFLHSFDIKLLSTVPQNSPLHLVGVQQPVSSCYVQISPKSVNQKQRDGN